MFVVNKNGDRLPVDNNKIDYDKGFHPVCQNVGLYEDEIKLVPIWIVQLQKDKNAFESTKKIELEFIDEVKFTHEPTENEILYLMSTNGLNLYDIVTIQKGFTLDAEYDD